MGEIRAYSKRQRWSDDEIAVLIERYATTTRGELKLLFPTRDIRSIECKANGLGIVRQKAAPRTPEEIRKSKRDGMARLREKDPQAARDKRSVWHAANRDKQTAKMREYYARRFFWGRANKLRGDSRATFKELASMWKAQRGLCAITGRRLDRTAQLDHILPRARGGGDEAANLRWVCEAANLAKRDMTDSEFVALCAEAMHWIGRQIEKAVQQ